ncbi:hypothetical protein SK854_15225 [Lentzea sp. BCCO 10_0061]|uniref:Uncharacterized protein n=1 Tax=Lentzea sokolovensis TaxID=3095429 RepID=A0ABU4UW36_9PSEU|nr:hypothetical protein [Lentzea sp. BCCO 10_0061]MDX8143475.1 hypothetical protein [Lentzea sp. BCCO 10_0061]
MSETLEQLYAAHVERPFPPRLRSVDVADVWFVLLDADIAACAQVVLRGGGLDSKRAAVLARHRADLELVLPLLTDSREVAYAIGLQALAVRCADPSRSL